jgi:hypothetical protein
MAKKYIVDNTETQVSGPCKKCLITVNAAYAGAIKVCDAITGSTANVATITGATVGSRYEYWDFTVGVRVVAAGACDITVNTTDQSR